MTASDQLPHINISVSDKSHDIVPASLGRFDVGGGMDGHAGQRLLDVALGQGGDMVGDVARSWEGLQPQIKLFLNSGLSGLGYMSSDIGVSRPAKIVTATDGATAVKDAQKINKDWLQSRRAKGCHKV